MKNRPPNVFLSSTMYDLSELRAQLRQFVDGLDWHAVMSEHESFPIEANQTTVENCRRNVRENADVFVMVVGARYGTVDTESDKSVTNLEFVEARARGVPVYVFVSRDVLAQLRVWESNPEADYSGVVDTPRVFEFIESFRKDGEVWTFDFDTAEDIVTTLRKQLAYLVQDALNLRQMASGQDRLLTDLEGDALMLALQRDQNWDVRLFATVFKEELERRTPLRLEIEHGLASGDVTFVDIAGLPSWALDRLHEVQLLGQTASTILNDYLPQVLGEDGEPGEIVAVARRLAQVWEDSARWTIRCRAVRVDDEARRVVDSLANANVNMLDEMWEFAHTIIPRLDEAIEALATGGPSDLDLTLTLTADMDEFNEALARFEKDYGRLVAEAGGY